MDVSGEQQIDVDHNVFKQRLRLDGTPFPELPEKEELGAEVKNVRLAANHIRRTLTQIFVTCDTNFPTCKNSKIYTSNNHLVLLVKTLSILGYDRSTSCEIGSKQM